MSAVVLRGRRVHFDAAGSGEPGFLLLHGWCCDRTTMAPLVERFAGRHRVLNADLPGHGLSDPGPAGYGWREVAADLVAVARAGGVDRPVLVGHSLGARLVLAAAAGAGPAGWARAVVLLDPLIEERAEHVAARMAEAVRPDWRSRLRDRVDGMFVPSSDPDARRRITELMLDTPHEAAVAALAAGDGVDAAAALRDCPCPVLYVGASRPRADARRLLELDPGLWYGQVVGSGHFVQVDAPEQVGAMIDEFIAVV